MGVLRVKVNGQWIDVGYGSAGDLRCRLSSGTIAALANATVGYVTFPVANEIYDTGNMHDATNPTRITLPASGLWRVGYSIDFTSFAAQSNQSWITVNRDITVPKRLCPVTLPGGNSVSVPVASGAADAVLAAGDYLELTVYQSSGGAMNIGGAGYGALWASFVGP